MYKLALFVEAYFTLASIMRAVIKILSVNKEEDMVSIIELGEIDTRFDDIYVIDIRVRGNKEIITIYHDLDFKVEIKVNEINGIISINIFLLLGLLLCRTHMIAIC